MLLGILKLLLECVDGLQIVLADACLLCRRHLVISRRQLLDASLIVVHLSLGGVGRGVHLRHHLHKLLHVAVVLGECLLKSALCLCEVIE